MHISDTSLRLADVPTLVCAGAHWLTARIQGNCDKMETGLSSQNALHPLSYLIPPHLSITSVIAIEKHLQNPPGPSSSAKPWSEGKLQVLLWCTMVTLLWC